MQAEPSDPVVEYFSGEAAGYLESSQSWPWSWLRAREIRAVRAVMPAVNDAAVLELGCGPGVYTRKLLEWGADNIVAVDIVPEMISELPKERVTGHIADAAAFATEDRFDLIFCGGLLEFVETPADVIANARRLAAPEASFVVLVPVNNMFGRLYRSFHAGHDIDTNLFDLPGLGTMAGQQGWKISASRTVWPFSLVARMSPCDD